MVETDYLNIKHRVTFRLGWANAIACLSTLQFGFHLAELNAPEEILSCKFSRKGPLSSFEDTYWYRNNFQQCIPMKEEQIAMITTMFTIGGLISSVVIGSNKISSNFGRRFVCFINAILYFLGSMIMTFTNSYWWFNVGRLLNGLAAGSTCVISPILVNELAPINHRGFLGSLLQLAVALGILLAQLISYLWSNDQQWRLIFLTAAWLALLQFLALFTTVESPKWLIINKGEVHHATSILHGLRSNKSTVHHEINHWRRLSSNSMKETKVTETTKLLNSTSSSESFIPLTMQTSRKGSIDPSSITTGEFLWKKKYRKEMIAVIVLMTSQQLVGMNAINFYGVKILKTVVSPGTNVLLITCSFSICNVICALLVSPLIDKLGRKPLLLSSILIMAVFSFTIGVCLTNALDYLVTLSFFGYIIGFSIGLAPIPYLMISEVTNHEAIGVAQSVGSTINWFSNILIAFSFPILQNLIGGAVFFIFSGICIMYFILTYFNVPETKGFNSYDEVWRNL